MWVLLYCKSEGLWSWNIANINEATRCTTLKASTLESWNFKIHVCSSAPALTFLGELDVGLSASVAVLHIAGVVAEVALLQGLDGERDGNLLFPKMLPDCPKGGRRKHGTQRTCFVWSLWSEYQSRNSTETVIWASLSPKVARKMQRRNKTLFN